MSSGDSVSFIQTTTLSIITGNKWRIKALLKEEATGLWELQFLLVGRCPNIKKYTNKFLKISDCEWIPPPPPISDFLIVLSGRTCTNIFLVQTLHKEYVCRTGYKCDLCAVFLWYSLSTVTAGLICSQWTFLFFWKLTLVTSSDTLLFVYCLCVNETCVFSGHTGSSELWVDQLLQRMYLMYWTTSDNDLDSFSVDWIP